MSDTFDRIWTLDRTSDADPVETIQIPERAIDREHWVPSALKNVLFGEARTYLLVDATLRTDVKGVFDLDVVEVPIACLFNGKAAEDQATVAPYLIDLTLTNDASPRFHRDFFANHWGRGTGIFLRSTAPLDEMKRHFRRFTKLQREGDSRWHFFRFWDPAIASVYFRTIQCDPLRIAQWFGHDLIDSYIVEENAGRSASLFKNAAGPGNTRLPPVILTDRELAPFRLTALDRHISDTAGLLKKDFATELKVYSPELIARRIDPAIRRFMQYGFTRKEYLHVIAAWAVFLGPDFETKDPDGNLRVICTAKAPETQRFAALKQRMSQLSGKKVSA